MNDNILKFKRCENCNELRNDGSQYVFDQRNDDVICRLCGTVVKKWNYSDRSLTFKDTAVAPKIFVPQDSLQKRGSQMINRFFPEESNKHKLHQKIEKIAELLEYEKNVVNRAKAQIEKFPRITKIRPSNLALASTLVVAKRSFDDYVNLKQVSRILGCNDLGKTVITVCNIMGLSQRSTPVAHIPKFLFMLGFKYKFVKHLKILYKKSRRFNGSIGSDTLMALVLIRFYCANKGKSSVCPSKISIEYIARLTFTSVSSIRGYIDGSGGKCTLYNKNILKNICLY